MLKNLFKSKDKKQTDTDDKNGNWFARLKSSLAKTRNRLLSQLSGVLRVGRKIDEELMEELEEILIQADVGINTTLNLMDNVRAAVKAKGLRDSSELEEVLKEEILNLLGGDIPLKVDEFLQTGGNISGELSPAPFTSKASEQFGQPNSDSEKIRSTDAGKPYTILVLGVNGAGKTTTIGKLASRFRSEGLRVLVAAGDTFRAAAEEQLAIWCERAGTELIRGGPRADPASVVFDAVHAAKHREADVLIVDTAGRLHTKKPLMDELAKIGRVMGRAHAGAPHEVLLVIDGTVGQNALMQAKGFNEAVPITGVAVTKLDGTAKGGIVLAVKSEIGAPVKLIGIGEKLDDLHDFAATDFVDALFVAEETAPNFS